MEFLTQYEGITIDFDCQFKVHLKDSRISTIFAAFGTLLPQLLMDFFQKVLVGSGEYVMALKKKLFACKYGNDTDFIWKTWHRKKTKVHGFYRWLELQQLQVQCKRMDQFMRSFTSQRCIRCYMRGRQRRATH